MRPTRLGKDVAPFFVPLLPLILSDSRDRRFEAQLRAEELGREAAQERIHRIPAQTHRQTGGQKRNIRGKTQG